jgi:hypothetical protein
MDYRTINITDALLKAGPKAARRDGTPDWHYILRDEPDVVRTPLVRYLSRADAPPASLEVGVGADALYVRSSMGEERFPFASAPKGSYDYAAEGADDYGLIAEALRERLGLVERRMAHKANECYGSPDPARQLVGVLSIMAAAALIVLGTAAGVAAVVGVVSYAAVRLLWAFMWPLARLVWALLLLPVGFVVPRGRKRGGWWALLVAISAAYLLTTPLAWR